MTAKKKTATKTAALSQSELIKQLTEAGYTLDSFGRKGDALTLRLSPCTLIDDGAHTAETICRANHLQARCNTFETLLIVRVVLKEGVRQEALGVGDESTETTAQQSTPSNQQSTIINPQSGSDSDQ
jgi:hypothetical protein